MRLYTISHLQKSTLMLMLELFTLSSSLLSYAYIITKKTKYISLALRNQNTSQAQVGNNSRGCLRNPPVEIRMGSSEFLIVGVNGSASTFIFVLISYPWTLSFCCLQRSSKFSQKPPIPRKSFFMFFILNCLIGRL